MRTLRIELLHDRRAVPLVVRARFERTSLGLGAFAGVMLFLGGAYMVAEALMHP
jgi:hypothetical protein